MRTLISLMMAVAVAALGGACGDDSYDDPPIDHDGGMDAELHDSMVVPDVPDLPERPISAEGPVITIQTPQPDDVLSGQQALVTVTVTDTDGVDVSSVKAVIPGGSSFGLSRSGSVDDQYSGNIDLSELPTGTITLFVEAADILDNWNSETVTVRRDTGPTVRFISPEDGERYAGSMNLSFQVSDPGGVDESSVLAAIGAVGLDINKLQEDDAHGTTPQWILFGSTVEFDDPMFDPPLQGVHQVTVTAQNLSNSVEGEGSVSFIVDNDGPTITVLQPVPGKIVGGIITIEADVQDPAGVQDNSVVAVVGNNASQWQMTLEPINGTYSATFDTSQLPSTFVFPTLSVRAADMLNNESEVGWLIAVDNTRPILSLDPPESFHYAKYEDGVLVCSRGFDPVGPFVPDDASTVPQIFFMRARIEDRGNEAPGLLQEMVSLIDYTTPRVYFLGDPGQALVVDTNGDGYCDEINPELLPTTNPQGTNEVLALYMDPIEPSGHADYQPFGPLPAGCDTYGDDTAPPDPLCEVLRTPAQAEDRFSTAIHYTTDTTEPAIWSLPLVDASDPVFCSGHQFDTLAGNLPEGWTCVAARAVDNAGNIGVSEPLRVCIDYEPTGDAGCESQPPPDCTGTIDPSTQVVEPAVPCDFDPNTQKFRSDEVRIQP